jgi:hypothetical protein
VTNPGRDRALKESFPSAFSRRFVSRHGPLFRGSSNRCRGA